MPQRSYTDFELSFVLFTSGESECVERDWIMRWWSQDRFAAMLRDAGFGPVRFVDPAGGPSLEDASLFFGLAYRQPDPGG